ncbi:hypothetical protein Trydic_g11615 [Trypoxylus dichotomus]
MKQRINVVSKQTTIISITRKLATDDDDHNNDSDDAKMGMHIQVRIKNPNDLKAEEQIASMCDENDNSALKSRPLFLHRHTFHRVALNTV